MATFVTFLDTTTMPESDQFKAEDAYEAAVLSLVPSIEILKAIIADNTVGLNAGLDHFEDCQSAFVTLDSIGADAARKTLGYWPGGAAHFEINF